MAGRGTGSQMDLKDEWIDAENYDVDPQRAESEEVVSYLSR